MMQILGICKLPKDCKGINCERIKDDQSVMFSPSQPTSKLALNPSCSSERSCGVMRTHHRSCEFFVDASLHSAEPSNQVPSMSHLGMLAVQPRQPRAVPSTLRQVLLAQALGLLGATPRNKQHTTSTSHHHITSGSGFFGTSSTSSPVLWD